MPKLSKRSGMAYESPIRKLAPSANLAEAQGKKVFYLNIGQPDILTPASAIQAVRDADIPILKYAPAKGITSFRKKLLKQYRDRGFQLDLEDIFITNGASEALQLLMMACLDSVDNILVPEPMYANYIGFSEMANATIKPLTCHIENGFDLPSIEAFDAAVDEHTKAILICNPNNPTGAVYTKEKLTELGHLCKKHDIFLFVDEVYSAFCYDDETFFSALQLEGLEDHVAVIDSVSKRFSACGARIGYILCQNPKVMEAINKYAQFRLSAPTMGQIFAEALIDVKDEYLVDVKDEYIKRRAVLYSRLSVMEDIVCYQPSGAFYVFAQLPIENADHFCQWLLEDFEYKGMTIMLAPGSGFYASSGVGQDQVRIAYVLNEQDLEQAMDCLEAALKVYPYRTKARTREIIEV